MTKYAKKKQLARLSTFCAVVRTPLGLTATARSRAVVARGQKIEEKHRKGAAKLNNLVHRSRRNLKQTQRNKIYMSVAAYPSRSGDPELRKKKKRRETSTSAISERQKTNVKKRMKNSTISGKRKGIKCMKLASAIEGSSKSPHPSLFSESTPQGERGKAPCKLKLRKRAPWGRDSCRESLRLVYISVAAN